MRLCGIDALGEYISLGDLYDNTNIQGSKNEEYNWNSISIIEFYRFLKTVNSLLNDELVTTNISYCNVKKYFIDNDISCIVNDKPTNYLCNYAYHKVLKRNKNTIFIHVS